MSLKKIFWLGITDQTSAQERKRTELINKVCFSIALVTFPYIFIFIWAGIPLLGYLVIPVVFGYIGVLGLNRLQLYNLARVLMILTGNVAVTSFSFACGGETGISRC